MTTIPLPLSRPARLAAAEAEAAGWVEDCLARLAAGEDAAAGELYDRLGDELYGFALWLCGSAIDAADLHRRRRAPALAPRQLDLALHWQAPARGPVWSEHLAGGGGLGSGWD